MRAAKPSQPRRIGGGGRQPAQLSVKENGSEMARAPARLGRREGKRRIGTPACRADLI